MKYAPPLLLAAAVPHDDADAAAAATDDGGEKDEPASTKTNETRDRPTRLQSEVNTEDLFVPAIKKTLHVL